MRFEMGALSPSDLSPEAQRAKGEGTRRIEDAADARPQHQNTVHGRPQHQNTVHGRPQAEVDTESRRGFLRNVLTGAGAGAAMAYAYGRPAETAASELPELAADDPNAPEVESSLVTEGSVDKLRLAEQVAKMIESGAIKPTYAEGTREALAGAGVLAVAASEKGEKPVQKTRRGFLGTVAGLLGGTILVSAPEFARAQELAFVTYNVNSNERAKGDLSVQELERREMLGRNISLEEFTRMPECESPRAARLFAQHEAIIAYNKALRLRKQANGEKLEGMRPSPIITFPDWYHRSSKVSNDVVFSFFKLRDQVLIPVSNGGHQKVTKHYGVAQMPKNSTRQPHCLIWSGYLGTDRDKAESGMEKFRDEL